MPGGSGSTCAALTQAWVPKPPATPIEATRSPGFKCLTPSPAASTTPENSLPGTKGSEGLIWYLACTVNRSGEVQAGRMHRDAHLAGRGFGRRQFGPAQRLDADRVLAKPSVHLVSLECVDAYSDRQRRRLPRARPRGAGSCDARAGRDRRDRAGAERERHLQLAVAAPAALAVPRQQRLFLCERHAVGLRARGAHRPLAAAPGPGALGHQQRRQHGRRHAVLGHRGRGDGGLPLRHPGHRVLPSGKRLGPPRRCGRGGARGGRIGARGARSIQALSAQRQHPQPRRCARVAASSHPTGTAPRQRAGDPAGQPARRDDLLDRPGGRCTRGRRGHRLPRHRERAVSITPMQVDLTDHARLPDWRAALGGG